MPRGQKNPLALSLSRRVFRTREKTGLSGHRLAALAELSNAHVRNIEDGVVPAIDTVEKIAAGIGVSPGWLAFGQEGFAPFMKRRPGPVVEPDEPEPSEQRRVYRQRHAQVGERLAAARGASGLSMRALAEHAGVSPQTWSNTESGATIPKVDSLERMAVALGVAPAWLAYGEDDAPR